MIESNFIYFATLNTFNEQKENIKDESIAFIAKTQQIYNRGVLYDGNDVIITTGNGDKYVADDRAYKAVSIPAATKTTIGGITEPDDTNYFGDTFVGGLDGTVLAAICQKTCCLLYLIMVPVLAITEVCYSFLVGIELKYKFYMYKYLILLLFILLFSCKPQQVITQITDTKTIEKIVNDTITVQVRIPQESESVTVQCDSSFVETSIAYSKAKIDSNGNLHHMIANKDTIITKDTIYSYKEITKEVFTTKDKIVEKKVVPWWCYMMIALSGGLFALLLIKLFR